MPTKYLDPKNDLAFKKIFGTEKHKSIPIDFLNAVLCLKGEKRIKDLQFLNPRQPAIIDARKESIVDVLVQDERGIKYIVEMQVAKVEGFEKRAQYYAAKTYCSHFGKGGIYSDLKKVIFLAITDYVVFPEKEKRYKSDHVLLDTTSHEYDLKDFSFTFVELPKFQKTLSELKTIEDRWYYFLKHADESENIEEVISNHKEIEEAYDVLNSHHWTNDEMALYEKFLFSAADAKGMILAAKNEGIQEGIEQGMKQGMKQGVETGDRQAKELIAKKMLSRGRPLSEIMEDTGLSEELIHKL